MLNREALNPVRDVLELHPRGLTTNEVANELAINRNTASKYLDVLQALGEVELRRYGPAKVWFLAPGIPLHALVDFSSSNVVIVDETLMIRQINNRLADIYGKTREALLGTHIATVEDLDAPMTIEGGTRSFHDCLRLALDGQHSQAVCHSPRYLGDEPLYFRLRCYPTMVTETVRGVVVIFDDMTADIEADRALAASEKRFRQLFESASDGIVITDNNLRITDLNNSALALAGYDEEALIGEPLSILFPTADYTAVTTLIDQGRSNDDLSTLETNLLTRAGQRRAVEVGVTAFTDDTGRFDGIQCLFRKIRDRHETAASHDRSRDTLKQTVHERTLALDRSERRYRTLVENITDVIVEIDIEGNFTYASGRVRDLFGFDPDEIIGMSAFSFIHPDDIEPAFEGLLDAFGGGRTIQMEFRTRHSNGKYIDVAGSGRVSTDDTGAERIVAVIRDVSMHKRAEEVLRTAEARFRAMVQNLYDTIMILDRDRRIQYVTDSSEHVWGYNANELLGRSTESLVHPADRERYDRLFEDLISHPNTAIHTEIRTKHRDGSWCYLEGTGINLLSDPNVGGLVVNFRNVTDRKMTEAQLEKYREHLEHLVTERTATLERTLDALRQAESEKQLILESVREHVIQYDHTLTIQWANPAAAASIGLDTADLVGKRCYQLWNDRDEPCEDCPVIVAMSTGQPAKIEKETPDGRWWFIRGYPMLDDDGAVIGGVEVSLEITDRKRAERARQAADERYRAVAESAFTGIGITDLHETLVYVNQAFADMLGYGRDELVGRNLADLTTPAEFERFREQTKARLRGKGEHYETVLIDRDCTTHTVLVSASALYDHNSNVYGTLGVITDITERKQIQHALAQSERRYRALVESSLDAILLFDNRGRIVLANNACGEIFGHEPESFIADRGLIRRLLHPDHHDELDVYWNQYRSTGIFPEDVTEWAWKRKLGGQIYTENHFRNLYDEAGQFIGLQVIMRNITERKRMEHMLGRMHADRKKRHE